MNSFFHLLRWDLTMQFRYGFWIAGIFATLPWAVILYYVPQSTAQKFLPACIFLDISVMGILFMAAIYFFEKREGSLLAVAITPIKTWQWLTSKLLTLGILGSTFCILLVAMRMGTKAAWGYILISAVCMNVLFILIGFLLASPFDKFNTFFVSFALGFGLMEIPALIFLDIYHPLYWIFPTQPTVAMLQGSFGDMTLGHFLRLLGIQLAWIAFGFWLSIKFYRRYVSQRMGG